MVNVCQVFVEVVLINQQFFIDKSYVVQEAKIFKELVLAHVMLDELHL